MLLHLEEPPRLLTDNTLPVQDQQDTSNSPLTTITSTSVEDEPITSEAMERATPPPPSSSPPPLSPVKGDSSCDHAEQWKEPQLNDISSHDNVDSDSCSSLDTDQLSNVDDLLEDTDQSINHSNLTATVAKGMNDSLGTLSNLSENITVSFNYIVIILFTVLLWQVTSPDLLESHNSTCPPPLPLSPPPDL